MQKLLYKNCMKQHPSILSPLKHGLGAHPLVRPSHREIQNGSGSTWIIGGKRLQAGIELVASGLIGARSWNAGYREIKNGSGSTWIIGGKRLQAGISMVASGFIQARQFEVCGLMVEWWRRRRARSWNAGFAIGDDGKEIGLDMVGAGTEMRSGVRSLKQIENGSSMMQ